MTYSNSLTRNRSAGYPINWKTVSLETERGVLTYQEARDYLGRPMLRLPKLDGEPLEPDECAEIRLLHALLGGKLGE